MARFEVIREDGTKENTFGHSEEEVYKVYEMQGIPLQSVKELPSMMKKIPQEQSPIEGNAHEDPILAAMGGMEKQKAGAQPTVAPPTIPTPQPQPQQSEMEFSANGVDFKLVNGMVFQKVWVDAKPGDEVRIVSAKGKIYEGEQYKVQIVKWKKVN